MKIQLWTIYYTPELMGIAPLSAVLARTLASRGHEVEVVAAHPHYPDPQWGSRALPYREVVDGIPVTRLPLIIGRESTTQRMLQELSFMASQTLASPFLGSPDVLVSATPSFPALLPGLVNSRLRRVPWVLWVQDILPDGAATTGYVDKSGPVYRLSRKLESAAYESAAHIVVLSESFRENLMSKGVPREKISLAYNPATMTDDPDATPRGEIPGPPRIMCMGNIGKSQNLVEIVGAFEADPDLAEMGAVLTLAGSGVAADEVRAAIRTDRVKMPGVLGPEELGRELEQTHLGAVTQAYSGGEFNVPSKLMNYLAVGLPVVASLRPGSEAGRIVSESGAGWVTDSVDPTGFPASVIEAFSDREELTRRGQAGAAFAKANLTPEVLADRFEAAFENLPRARRS